MAPFRVRYELTRRDRLAARLTEWAPCLAASLGFTLGMSFLAAVVSRWFLPALVLPVVMCRNFVPILYDILARPTAPVELAVDGDHLTASADGGEPRRFPLAGIVQVFRTGDRWTVIHAADAVLTVPAAAITDEQVAYLKSFTRPPGGRNSSDGVAARTPRRE